MAYGLEQNAIQSYPAFESDSIRLHPSFSNRWNSRLIEIIAQCPLLGIMYNIVGILSGTLLYSLHNKLLFCGSHFLPVRAIKT